MRLGTYQEPSIDGYKLSEMAFPLNYHGTYNVRPILWDDFHTVSQEEIAQRLEEYKAHKTIRERIVDILFYIRFESFLSRFF